MDRYGRSSHLIALMDQVVVTAFDAPRDKARSVQSGQHLPCSDLRQPAHTRASFAGTISLTVLSGSASEVGIGLPSS